MPHSPPRLSPSRPKLALRSGARIAPFLIALVLTGACTSASARSVGLQCADLPEVVGALAGSHVMRPEGPAQLADRTASRFVELLDPSKSLLVGSDAEQVAGSIRTMVAGFPRPDCAALAAAGKLRVERAKEDQRTVGQVLGPKYKLDESVELIMDSERRSRAKDAKERASLVTRLVHFQMAGLLAAGLETDAAKKQLIKRYDLATKRYEERLIEMGELFAEAFAQALDPHTAYLSSDALENFEIDVKLSLEGIGATLRSEDGFTVIESLVPGGQAEKSGKLQAQDKIIAVAQAESEPVSVIDMDLTDVVRMIRGKRGTVVVLTILRSGAEKTLDVKIVRDQIDLAQQAAKLTVETRKIGGKDRKLGIIELPSFYGNDDGGRHSHTDVAKLIAEARGQGVDGLVIDVSRNGGGLLVEAVEIAGLFIREGAVVAARDSIGRTETFVDDDDLTAWAGPMVVLTSPGSASASEILAGALRSYRRAVVVGSSTTFGKGTVQTLMPLPERRGALKVTTALFFVPNGDSTQQRGVPSDVVVPSMFDAYDVGDAKLPYSLPPQSMAPFRSDTVNANGDLAHWRPIEEGWLPQLENRSSERVNKSKEFRELREEVEEVRQQRGRVAVADIYGEDVAKKDEAAHAEHLASITRDEAINVLADLVELTEVGRFKRVAEE